MIEQQLCQATEGGIHFCLVLIGDSGRLLVRPLDESNSRSDFVHAQHVRLGSAQTCLQGHAQLAVAKAPERLENLQCHVRIGRPLHVDAHEEAVVFGRLQDSPQVVDARCLVDVEAELGQLEGQITLDTRGDDDIEKPYVLTRRGGRRGYGAYAFAEVI